MKLLTFKKGIFPPHGKYLTENKPIENLLPKQDLIFPMSQHIGAPCTPLVKKGDRVLVGQRIGEPQGFVSAPVHSSVSGIVKDIKPVMTPSGSKTNAVIVENDNEYEEFKTSTTQDYNSMSNESILKLIKDAGIVGMGGAGFPTHIKLSPSSDKPINTIIINAAECEPYLTCDYRLMLEEPKEIIEGIKIILKLFPSAKAYIGIEDNKIKAINTIKKLVDSIPNIDVAVLKTKYPQGAEKQLIYSIVNKEVPSGKLPADIGCIVQNVDTVREIYNAVVLGRPLMTRIVTVTGDAIKNPKNLRVKLGTSWNELIEACDGFVKSPTKIISGGPMMGTTVPSTDIPVVKGTSGILCLTEKQAVLPIEESCIRCGKCVEACPMNLLPLYLDIYSRSNNDEEFKSTHGLDCIECGCCSYSCPAKRHLLHRIRTAKRRIISKNRK